MCHTVGAAGGDAEQGGCVYPYFKTDIIGGSPVGHVVRVVDVDDYPPYW